MCNKHPQALAGRLVISDIALPPNAQLDTFIPRVARTISAFALIQISVHPG